VTSEEGRHGYVEIVVVPDTEGADGDILTIGANRYAVTKPTWSWW
jgi:hypothetical protein